LYKKFKMKKSNLYFGSSNSFPAMFMLVLFSLTIIGLSSCSKEDDIPPPSAYVPPEPDTTGGCVFLTVFPELNEDEAISFECEGPEYTFFGEKDGSITIEYADNPATGGINTSDRVVQVTQAPGVEPWAGFYFDLSAKIDFSQFQGIKVKVYAPAAGEMVNLKLEDSADGSISTETSITTTVGNEWEELCFPFSTNDSDKFDRFVLFFDFQGPKDTETVHYFDEIILGDECMTVVGPTDEPSIAAPAPVLPESEVISIYSDSYMDVAGTDFNPNWGQATVVTEITVQDDHILKYENLNYQGVALGSAVNAADMSFLHIDYWTANSTALSGFLISTGPMESPHAFELTTEEWVGVDIPLSEFSDVVDIMDIIQMKFEGNGTVYLDNIYFHKGQPMGPTTAAPNPTVDEADVISIFSDSYTNVEGTDFNPNWGQATVVTQVDLGGNNTLRYENLNFQGTMFASALDVSGMTTLHIDYWTATSTGFSGFLISPGPAETSHTFEVTRGEWVGVDIALSEFSDIVDLMNVIQMKFEGDGTLYLDNIYFYREEATEPMTSAPTPDEAEADVISIFSDAYTNVADTDYNPNWGQATVVTQVEIEGDNILKYENLNYQGTMLGSAIDVTEMNFLHVDYWTANSTGFSGFLISPGPLETPYAFTVTTGEWISLDIPMSEFSGDVDLAEVFQLKFEGDGTIFLDNIYFFK